MGTNAMEPEKRITFVVLWVVLFVGWMAVGPRLFPNLFPQPPKPGRQAAQQAPAGENGDGKVPNADAGEGPEAATEVARVEPPRQPEQGRASEEDAAPPTESLTVPRHPRRSVILGSPDPDSGYFLHVRLSTRGAAVEWVELNDPRYEVLEPPEDADPVPQVKIVGNHLLDAHGRPRVPDATVPLSFETDSDAIDALLQKVDRTVSLRTLDWDVEKVEKDDAGNNTAVTFGIRSPDGQLHLRKTYRLTRKLAQGVPQRTLRDTDPEGYLLHVTLSVTNEGEAPTALRYRLRGPVGVLLENAENTYKYRDLKAAFLTADGELEVADVLHAGSLIKAFDKGEVIDLHAEGRRFFFADIDVQYFTAAVFPTHENATHEEGYWEKVEPVVVQRHPKPERSDISFWAYAHAIDVPPGKTVDHTYRVFLGPKRSELIAALNAQPILDFSTWFGIGYIGRGLTWLLTQLHELGIPYGIAIVLMTLMVRGCMFPLSKKQAIGAARMKELQPKLQALKEKYGHDRERFAREQLKLFQEHNYNPLSGCLPVLLQMPIFFGLYQALRYSVDLRGAPFLWIDNLAAPDELFPLPFRVPVLGWTTFNLLPVLTIALFIAQQKMFMPPPTDEQTRMQMKMMNFMMIFMGVMFYRVPAGLCVYFIASSLWSMAERKLLDKYKSPTQPSGTSSKTAAASGSEPAAKKEGFFERLQKRLEELSAPEIQQQVREGDQKKKKRRSRSGR
ncbi:MAG: membrane protein insertase YidC [Planctomycetota bacterium]|nr:MAG: membrane protein insertase YidC [Planctomycetota bacterium]